MQDMRTLFPTGRSILLTVALALLPFVAGAQTATEAALPENGAFIRAESGDTKVYYIESGLKRWIQSAEAFTAHDFRWSDVVTVPLASVAKFPDGAPILVDTNLSLPSEKEVLPDLIPFAAQDLRLAQEAGRTVLRFTAIFWNAGHGRFELVSHPGTDPAADAYEPTYQHILNSFGTYRDPLVGSFFWHQTHRHYHFLDFADYTLEPIATGSNVSGSTKKTTFCMRDDTAVMPSWTDAPRYGYFAGCTSRRQGVSIGWADRYASSLPDQFVDVQDVPAGLYKLTFNVDPRGKFIEKRRDNNMSATFVELDVAKGIMKPVAYAAPFVTSRNVFPDGMLLRGDKDAAVFVIKGNKRRPLRTPEIFASYGYDLKDVRVLPQSIVDVIPRGNLIRLAGSPEVYLVNETGYRRHLRSLAVLASYGGVIMDVNKSDFDSYRDTDMIIRMGEKTVYAIEGGTKKELGPIESLRALGRDPAAVQVVSDVDFHFYLSPTTSGLPTPDPNAVQVVADGLFVPWDIAFLPDGDLLVTERNGTLRRIGKRPTTIALPSLPSYGEGGLMGMALHPKFAENAYVYLYYTIQLDGKRNRVSRFKLDGDRLIDEKVIIDNIPAAIYHDGGQLIFGPDGMLYVTTGDAEVPANSQNTGSLAGKTLRVTPDGGVPADNPFGHRVWSYGHRNGQGLAWDQLGRLWETEHGRSGALSGLDELNLIVKGGNYGWPTIQGDQTGDGMITPARNSGPDVTWAPSGLTFADGSLFFAGLRGSAIYEVAVAADGSYSQVKTHLKNVYGRLRATVTGPDGYVYFTTSNRDGRGTPKTGDDKILRALPALIRTK